MNLNIYILPVIFFLSFYLSFSQNYRDITIHDSIYKNIGSDYKTAKMQIANLEKKYGYEPELKLIILKYSFKNKDLKYFKNELKCLVRDYGFNFSYLKKSSPYYKSITSGSLSKWFKKMYLKNHLKWLKTNFLKQIDIEKLNNLGNRDQLIIKFQLSLMNKFDDIDSKKKITAVASEYLLNEAMDWYDITRGLGAYPSAKNFALIQNSLHTLQIHNLKYKRNIDEFWKLFFPYFKDAYLKNEIDYIHFKNYDNLSYLNFKNQSFGLLNKDNLSDFLKAKHGDNETIPIKDSIFMKKIRKEFNWKKYKE